MQPWSWQKKGVRPGFRIISMPWKCRITSMIASRKAWWKFIALIMRGTQFLTLHQFTQILVLR
jgi:hypothetical protein